MPGMLHRHQIHIVVWRFWETIRLNGAWGVVDQFVRWFLGGVFRPRSDDMIGEAISLASQTKLQTHMLIFLNGQW